MHTRLLLAAPEVPPAPLDGRGVAPVAAAGVALFDLGVDTDTLGEEPLEEPLLGTGLGLGAGLVPGDTTTAGLLLGEPLTAGDEGTAATGLVATPC